MDQTTRDQLYAHTLVWCWPWLWWQLWRLDLYVWATGRDVAFAVNQWGQLRIKFIGDDPYAPKAWTPYSMRAYAKPFEMPDGTCLYTAFLSADVEQDVLTSPAEGVIVCLRGARPERGRAWVTTDPMRLSHISPAI